MPEMTLTQKRQAEERAEAAARAERRKNAFNKGPSERATETAKGKGTFQVLPHKNRNTNDPSLRRKVQQQKIQSFTTKPGEAVKFSDQE